MNASVTMPIAELDGLRNQLSTAEQQVKALEKTQNNDRVEVSETRKSISKERDRHT
jgi:hypothetical protein